MISSRIEWKTEKRVPQVKLCMENSINGHVKLRLATQSCLDPVEYIQVHDIFVVKILNARISKGIAGQRASILFQQYSFIQNVSSPWMKPRSNLVPL